MKRFLGVLLVVVALVILAVLFRPDIRPEIKWAELPVFIQTEALAARLTAGAHVFTDQGTIYLLVSVGEAQQGKAHLRLLKKNTLDNISHTLIVHFEQYAPRAGEPGGPTADDWFCIVAFRESSPRQIKVVIDGVEQYTVAVPE